MRLQSAFLITTLLISSIRHGGRGSCGTLLVMVAGPFVGSVAVGRGLVTRAQLRSDRYVSPFRDVFVTASDRPLDLATLSRAAFLLLGESGALAGYSAAELLGAACAPRGAPAEVVSPGTGIRARAGLVVHRDAVPRPEVWQAQGCRVTSPVRTAWDLARRLDLVDAVVAVDALCRRGRFPPGELLAWRAARPRTRGAGRLPAVAALADPRAESPPESRLRLLLVLGGLPAPEVQFRVRDAGGVVVARADLAYPKVRLAIEYDGDHHNTRRTADNRRDIALAELGWETMRFTAADLCAPARVLAAVARMLAARERMLGSTR